MSAWQSQDIFHCQREKKLPPSSHLTSPTVALLWGSGKRRPNKNFGSTSVVKIGRSIESIILSWSSIADDILCESQSHMYMNPLIHHYYWARGLTHCWLSGACPIMWTADQFFFFREIFFIIITILVTEPPSIISIVILNSVPLERADVANMGGGDWRRGHPLNTQCALQCHGIQQTTLHFSVF